MTVLHPTAAPFTPSHNVAPITPSVNEAFDIWFDSFQKYETTLEDMATASLNIRFKEELTTMEQWFRLLSESERTASIYSLLQNCNQNQIQFFIAVLQQMSKADPMTAFLSPAPSASMQRSQLKRQANMSINLPGTPSPGPFSARNMSSAPASANLHFRPTSSPSAADAAATLAHQRSILKASNHVIYPVAPTTSDGRTTSRPPSGLSQVVEDGEKTPTTATHIINENIGMTPAQESWASMVNTPSVPMFQKPDANSLPAPSEWPAENTVPKMMNPKTFRRAQGSKDQRSTAAMNMQVMMSAGLGSAGAPMTPFNVNLHNAAGGVSLEAQLLAVQLGLTNVALPSAGTQKRGGQKNQHWKGNPPSATVRSPAVVQLSAGLKSGEPASAGSKTPDSAAVKREEEWDPEMLNDIQAWFKTERLHKYAPNFDGMGWREIVVLDDVELEKKGIAAVGARRRLLKIFELARVKMGMEEGAAHSQGGVESGASKVGAEGSASESAGAAAGETSLANATAPEAGAGDVASSPKENVEETPPTPAESNSDSREKA